MLMFFIREKICVLFLLSIPLHKNSTIFLKKICYLGNVAYCA
jgi:hypothetical protein